MAVAVVVMEGGGAAGRRLDGLIGAVVGAAATAACYSIKQREQPNQKAAAQTTKGGSGER